MKKILSLVTRGMLACAFSVCAAAPAVAEVQPEIARGLQWLTQRVQANGTLEGEANSIATPLQNRAVTVQALKLLSGAPSSVVDAIDAETENSTEYLARKMIALASAGRDISPHTLELFSRQNADGGFGGALGYNSNPIDTAFALLAAKSGSDVNATVLAGAMAYLLPAQQVGGCYTHAAGAPSAYVTALVSTALQISSGSVPAMTSVNRANACLLSMQRPDGGWGTVEDTSLVYLALAGTSSDTALQNIVTASILSRQGGDGSWNGDPYVSALALRALMAHPFSEPIKGEVTGQLSDASTGRALAGATVLIQQIPGASTASDAAGKFLLVNVPAGSYSVTISAPGYTAKAVALVARNAATADLGVVALTPVATSGIIQGIAKDGGSGLPLAGVSIAAAGENTVSAISQADGTYKLTGVAPGAIKLSASKDGYESVLAEGVVVAGGVQAFSPSLKALVTSGGVTGRVVDGDTQLPLAGVALVLVGQGQGAITGADGRFNMTGIAAGTVVVNMALATYAPVSFSAIIGAGRTTDVQNIGLYKTIAPAINGTIQGVVKDDVTGLPLAGAAIVVSGSANLAASTGSDGSFSLTGVTPGNVTVQAGKDGYTSASGSASVVAGATVVFSPRLQLVPLTGISGQVVDSVTHTPLTGVAIGLDATATGAASTVSDVNGRFTFGKVAGGSHTLTLRQDGYEAKALSLVTSAGTVSDLPAIPLVKRLSMIVISGKVTDSKTNQGIAKATVAVLGTALATLTDASGNYRIESIPSGMATVRFGAVGYTGDTVMLDLSDFGEVSVDRVLQAGQGGSITLALATEQGSYAAYAPISIQAEVHNSGTQTNSGTVSVIILNEQGDFLDSLQATRIDASGASQRTFDFAPGTTTVNLPWNSLANPPGSYSAIARIHQGGSESVGGGAVELAQNQLGFVIAPTAAIESAQLMPLPGYSNLGAVEQIGFRLDVVNRSNIPVSSTLSYQLRTPGMALIHSSTLKVDLLPAESAKSFLLGGVQYQFLGSGLYPSTLTAMDGIVPFQLVGKPISVAPATRIEPRQSVTPAAITPDGDKRLHIDIHLQGVETK